jgi:hypothetical protein
VGRGDYRKARIPKSPYTQKPLYRAQNGVINWVVIPLTLNQGQIWVMGPKTGSELRLFTLKLDLWTAFGYMGFSEEGLLGIGAFGYTGFSVLKPIKCLVFCFNIYIYYLLLCSPLSIGYFCCWLHRCQHRIY